MSVQDTVKIRASLMNCGMDQVPSPVDRPIALADLIAVDINPN